MNKALKTEKILRYKTVVFVNAFFIGAIIMALEMAGSRFLTPFFGSSVYTWASIISMVLLSLAAGYFLGGYWAERKPGIRFAGFFVLLAAIGILLIPLYYESLYKTLYDFFDDPKTGGFFGALLTLFVPLLFLGMYAPYSVKLLSNMSDKTGKVAGSLYAVSTIGSIFGTLGVTFFFIPIFGSKVIAYGLSFVSFLSAVSLFSLKDLSGKSVKIVSIAFMAVYLCLFVLIVFNPRLKNAEASDTQSDKYLLEIVESEYNTIAIKQKEEYISMTFRRHKAGHIESKINVLNELELPLGYTQLLQSVLFYKTNPKNMLVVGLGGGRFSSYIKQYYKDIKITGVELDPEVVRLSKKYFNLKEDSKYKIVNIDGRLFLLDSESTYDIIILDAYKGGYIPFHLCTSEFYTLVSKDLSDEGIVALNLHSGSKLFGSILSTLKTIFRNIDIYTLEDGGNVVVLAYNFEKISDSVLSANADSLQNKYNFYHNLNQVFGRKDQLSFETADILTDDFAPVNYLNAIDEHNRKK